AADILAHWDVTTGAFTVHPGHYQLIAARSAGRPELHTELTITGPTPEPRRLLATPLRAVDFDDYEHITLVDATRADGDAVTPDGDQGELLFRNVDLTGVGTVTAEVSRTSPGSAHLELRAGDSLLATVTIPSTGDRYAWITVLAEVDGAPSGVHDLRVVLTGEQRLATLTFAP
ncbi:carbohydrate-binding protein, partial [Streptacidiphilus monticola]